MGRPARITLHPADGTEPFVLSGQGMGNRNVELATAPAGFFHTPIETIYTQHAYEIGATYAGERINAMMPVFTVNCLGTRQRPWELVDDEWSTAMSTRIPAVLEYETGSRSSTRTLKVRLKQEPILKPIKDPNLGEFGQVTMTCIAPDPFWREDAVPDKWISEVSTLDGHIEWGSVTVSNPTPYPIWVTWKAQAGPNLGTQWWIPDFSWGNVKHRRAEQDADRMIRMPPLLANEHIDIDTDEMAKRPQVLSPIDTQIYMRMEGETFVYPLRPYLDPVEVPVGVSRAPAGVGIQVSCPRPWPKPWGMRR